MLAPNFGHAAQSICSATIWRSSLRLNPLKGLGAGCCRRAWDAEAIEEFRVMVMVIIFHAQEQARLRLQKLFGRLASSSASAVQCSHDTCLLQHCGHNTSDVVGFHQNRWRATRPARNHAPGKRDDTRSLVNPSNLSFKVKGAGQWVFDRPVRQRPFTTGASRGWPYAARRGSG